MIANKQPETQVISELGQGYVVYVKSNTGRRFQVQVDQETVWYVNIGRDSGWVIYRECWGCWVGAGGRRWLGLGGVGIREREQVEQVCDMESLHSCLVVGIVLSDKWRGR